MDRTFSDVTTPGKSGPECYGSEGVLCIPGASLSDCLVSYSGDSLEGSYSSAEMQSVYSTASPDWAEPVRTSYSLVGWFLYLMAYQPFLGYLMPKPFS